jgi:lysophospholipase L1-like esterase
VDSGRVKVARLGDSIIWGQGLREENKWSSLLRQWLETASGAPVDIDVFAHSGARMEAAAAPELHGEVPFASPSIPTLAQRIVGNAAYAQSLDLIVLDGGINDVQVSRILNPRTAPNEIRRDARRYCLENMRGLLATLYDACSNARIVVLGYYPIVTDETSFLEIAKVLVGFLSVFDPANPWLNARVAIDAAPALKATMVANSAAFAQTANNSFRQAAEELNQRAARDNRERQPVAVVADPGWRPEHGYGAGATRVWQLDTPIIWPITPPFEMWRTNDELYDFRIGRRGPCNDARAAVPNWPYTEWLFCRVAGVGHPNLVGAAALANAIQVAYEPFLKDLAPQPAFQHVVYPGSDNRIHELWWSEATGWAEGELAAQTASAPPAAGNPAGSTLGGTQHVVYRGTDDRIHELWWSDGRGWAEGELTAQTGAAPAAAGDPAGYVLGGTQHVVYRGTDSRIHELWWSLDNGWQVGALSATPNAPPAAGDPAGYVLGGTQHVVYRGDDRIQELWWSEATGWQVGALSATPGAPPAAGDPAGYVRAPT